MASVDELGSVVLADCGRGFLAERVEQADGVGLAGEFADGRFVGPLEGRHLAGKVAPARPRRHRSTRRRQDAPPLPRRKVDPRTVGKTYTTPDGKTFRPSLFLTLTCPSYGRVTADGTPTDPDSYDYVAAARDALHFAALFDRFIQNLRRYCGYDLQYFAAIEPQRRLAPHVHMALRGTVSRRELREVITATYHQVWWPSAASVRFDGDHLPVWEERAGTYVDQENRRGAARPGTRRSMPSATPTSRCTSQGSARSSARRACWPDRGTPGGASAT